MGYSYTTNRATDQSSIVRGNASLVSGNWSGSAGTAFIYTGGSKILAGDAVVAHDGALSADWTAGTTGALIGVSLNTGSAGTENGVMAIRCPVDQKGSWGAIVQNI